MLLVLATRNRHKADEIRAVLGPFYTYRTLADLPDAPRTQEDGLTFAANASKKACELAVWLSASAAPAGWVLADDSGLEVDALGGAPGVHSARFAAMDTHGTDNSGDAENNAKLLTLLHQVPASARSARFRCAMALATVAPRPSAEIFEGVCEGQVLRIARGTKGFGYDPLFQPAGYEESFAELGEAIKNQISHRARALEAVRQRLAQKP